MNVAYLLFIQPNLQSKQMELYQIGRSIGVGSFGQVFLCKHRHQQVANYVVKKLRLIDSSDRQKENIEFELRLLQKLRHPNIISYKDNFIDKDGNLCIVMVYCQGGDMFAKIRATKDENRTFSEPQILDWLIQLSLAIYYLHNQKILHRDLKPQNIFLRSQRIQLGDFGIAKILDTTQDIATTAIGTPYYMAPQVFKSKPYSYKSDIWSLGCILYEMCNLRRAFDAQNVNALAIKIMRGAYPSIIATYSKQLRDLINSMLLVNPNKRPTIVQILKKPFLRKRVQKYISDIFTRSSQNSKDMQFAYLDTLQQQASLLNIQINPPQDPAVTSMDDPLKRYPSSKQFLDNGKFKAPSTKRGDDENGHMSKRKSIHDRDSLSVEKGIKKENTQASASTKAISLLEEKQVFVDHKKKGMLEMEKAKEEEERRLREKEREQERVEREERAAKIEREKRLSQGRVPTSQYKDEVVTKRKPFKVQEDYDMEESKDVSFEEEIGEQIIQELDDEEETVDLERQQSALEDQQYEQQASQQHSPAYYKLLNKIMLLRHRCKIGLGQQKYKKLYNAVARQADRQKLVQILGQDQIGYWHLVDQILFNQSFLKMMQNGP